MQSTLFTTLTATEEASLSGGHKKKKTTTTTPTITAPKPITLTLNFKPIITQIAINVNTGDVKGNLIQTAANQIGV